MIKQAIQKVQHKVIYNVSDSAISKSKSNSLIEAVQMITFRVLSNSNRIPFKHLLWLKKLQAAKTCTQLYAKVKSHLSNIFSGVSLAEKDYYCANFLNAVLAG